MNGLGMSSPEEILGELLRSSGALQHCAIKESKMLVSHERAVGA